MNIGNSPLVIFQKKVIYFHVFNGCFASWALLAMIYYIFNTVNINCSQRKTFPTQSKVISSPGPSPMASKPLSPSSAFG